MIASSLAVAAALLLAPASPAAPPAPSAATTSAQATKPAAPAPVPAGTAAAAADTPELPFESFRLKNGLFVILHRDPTAPIVGVHVQYDVGSKDERPGRTGFAHLFEHLMFQGTKHLPKGEDDRLLEAAGGEQNGSTSQDTTQYWQQAPSNALEQLLFSQSERMGFLLPTLDQAKLDNQRDVVRNERRENYEMRPYGLVFEKLLANLWTPDFPYHWQPIGTHEDLEAATLQDVKEFFERWYGPENAVLAIAGDIDLARTHALVERWFGEIPGRAPPGHASPTPTPIAAEKRLTMEDRVQLPRIHMAWQSPAVFKEGDAALDLLAQILSDGKSARLVKRLVMDEQIAQNVSAGQSSQALAGMFLVAATPKPGIPVARVEQAIDEELARIARTPPTAEELQRAKNKVEAGAVFGLEPVGGFGGRAATLANYYLRTGDPGYLPKDLGRYRQVTAEEVSQAARTWLGKEHRVVLTVNPRTPSPMAPSAPRAAGSAR